MSVLQIENTVNSRPGSGYIRSRVSAESERILVMFGYADIIIPLAELDSVDGMIIYAAEFTYILPQRKERTEIYINGRIT